MYIWIIAIASWVGNRDKVKDQGVYEMRDETKVVERMGKREIITALNIIAPITMMPI